MDIKEYRKRYYQSHKEELNENIKRFMKEHPEWSKEYYQKNKEKMNEYTKKWINKSEENKKRFSKSCAESRKRRVAKLREQGCTNAWCVVQYKAEPKYKEV